MQGLKCFRIPSAAVRRTVGVTVVSTITLLGAACGGKGAASGPMAGPPVAAQPMPPLPDLTQVRTFTRPIPGLPADKTGLTNAALQQMGDLRYPEAAWNRGLQGWAVYDFVVAANGRVDPAYVRLVKASDDVFARPAEDAVRAARFTPATQDGTAVPTLVRLPVYFSLDQASRR